MGMCYGILFFTLNPETCSLNPTPYPQQKRFRLKKNNNELSF